jgi:hypothetical protein
LRTNICLDKVSPLVSNPHRVLVWGIAMQDYDIHLFNEAGQLSLNMSGSFLNNGAAIHAAQQLCKKRERVEVWSSEGCIFASRPRDAQPRPAA